MLLCIISGGLRAGCAVLRAHPYDASAPEDPTAEAAGRPELLPNLQLGGELTLEPADQGAPAPGTRLAWRVPLGAWTRTGSAWCYPGCWAGWVLSACRRRPFSMTGEMRMK
jgi:hypothetical protein